jgi:hypothetical protein
MPPFTDADIGKLFKTTNSEQSMFTVKIYGETCEFVGDYKVRANSYAMYLGTRMRRASNGYVERNGRVFHCFLVDDITVACHEHLFSKSSLPIVFKGLGDDGNPDGTLRDEGQNHPVLPLNVPVRVDEPLAQVQTKNTLVRLWDLFHDRFVAGVLK